MLSFVFAFDNNNHTFEYSLACFPIIGYWGAAPSYDEVFEVPKDGVVTISFTYPIDVALVAKALKLFTTAVRVCVRLRLNRK